MLVNVNEHIRLWLAHEMGGHDSSLPACSYNYRTFFSIFASMWIVDLQFLFLKVTLLKVYFIFTHVFVEMNVTCYQNGFKKSGY